MEIKVYFTNTRRKIAKNVKNSTLAPLFNLNLLNITKEKQSNEKNTVKVYAVDVPKNSLNIEISIKP